MNPVNQRTTGRLVRAGFTLIEVMIVIAIILALSGLIGVALFQRRDEAKKQLVQIDLNSMKSALKQFRLDYERWPTDEEGITVLWDKGVLDGEADENKWHKYLDEAMPNDKWDRPWGYRQVSENGDEDTYDLWSVGPDGEEGTEDDITSWTKDSDEFGEGGGTTEGGTTGG